MRRDIYLFLEGFKETNEIHTIEYMKMLNTITHLSNILGLELSPPPNIYTYSTKIYTDDILDNHIQYKIVNVVIQVNRVQKVFQNI